VITVDNTTPTRRRPPTDVAGIIALTAANLGFFTAILMYFLASGLLSASMHWLSPHLATTMEAMAATHPMVGLLLSLLLCGIYGTFLIALVWASFRVGVTVYRKIVPVLLRWHQRRQSGNDRRRTR